jgi:hypothetical protein
MPQVPPGAHEAALRPLALRPETLEAKVENFFWGSGAPHFGHVTSRVLARRTNFSKSSPHFLHSYS